MRILAIDDATPIRADLERALKTRKDLEALDVAADGIEALAYLDQRSYDVILLNMHMRRPSSMEIGEHILASDETTPAIIFMTASDENSVQLFEQQDADYVLKPFLGERLHHVIDKALRRSREERIALLTQRLPRLETMLRAAPKIAIKTKGRIIFITPGELISAKAEGNYVLLQLRSGTLLLREQISALAEKLRPYGFIRIHRSVLVNASHVAAMEPLFTGEYLLRMKDGVEFNVTRTYKKNLKELASFWMGTDVEAAGSLSQ